MFKKALRLSALALCAALVLGQTAYADVVTAQEPGSTSTSAAVSSSSNTNPNGTKPGIISATGPSATKTLDANGVLVIGASNNANATDSKSAIGPGGSNGSYVINSYNNLTAPASQSGAGNNTTASAPQVTTASVNSSIAKPVIAGEAAVLFDATTNQILFEKNGSKAMYPASTTKMLTALLAAEKLSMSDTLTFNASAVNNLESGAVTASMKAGDTMTVQDAMHAMLLRSACEVANGLAEKVAGSQAAFAALMNDKAKALGCTGSNFENASGLNGANHYTTAVDMALITKAALNNSVIRGVLQTTTYTLPATSSRGSMAIKTSNRMAKGGADYYQGYIGGKTGYTSKAGSCLTGGIEVNGHQLIAVVFKSNGTQYSDTKALFDYGVKVIGGQGTQTTAQLPQASQTQTVQAPAATNTSNNTDTAAKGKWVDAGNGVWKYLKADGKYCSNEWLDVNGNTYFFNSDSVMCTGWKQFTNSSWYYFNPDNGAMVRSKWVTSNGKSYYLQASGVMAVNTVIDGKYKVDANGVYTEKVG